MMGSRPRNCDSQRFTTSPIHYRIVNSTTPNETKFAMLTLVSAYIFRFARGRGKARVLLYGMVNMICNGIDNAWAQWTWPILGRFAMMVSMTNGLPID
jgi:hypothetical protein